LFLLARRRGVYYADGRSNTRNAGRHSLGTRIREEALQQLALLDKNRAADFGLIPPPAPHSTENSVLLLAEGRRLYEEHLNRPIVARGIRADLRIEAREIECAVLGNDDPDASVPGEIVPSKEFYDYEAKYLDNASELFIPASITPAQQDSARTMSLEAFRAVDGAGLARVDFLMDGTSGAIFVNEINTLPGFTTISMYAKLWAASGVEYSTLLDRLVKLAMDRHAAKQRLKTSAF
jgi:hypothetical protein